MFLKAFLKKYALEIVITVIGSILTLLSLIMDELENTTFVIITVTFLSDIISLSIKNSENTIIEHSDEKFRELKLFNDLFYEYSNIKDSWKKDAQKELIALKIKFNNMYNGQRKISGQRLITYQADIMKSAKRRVYAIHRALDNKSLDRWDENRTSKDFTQFLIKANKQINPFVDKRRIFLVDSKDLEDEEFYKKLKKVLFRQTFVFGFKVKVLLHNGSQDVEQVNPLDMLICDDEVITVHFVDNIAEGTIETSEIEVSSIMGKFDEYWQIARPLNKININK